MRSRSARGAGIAAAVALAAACAGNGPVSITYSVLYHVAGTDNVAFDSVRYEDAGGSFVTVQAPARTWGVTLSMIKGQHVQASAWGHAVGSGSATLAVQWVVPGVSIAGDSNTASISARGNFQLAIPQHQL